MLPLPFEIQIKTRRLWMRLMMWRAIFSRTWQTLLLTMQGSPIHKMLGVQYALVQYALDDVAGNVLWSPPRPRRRRS